MTINLLRAALVFVACIPASAGGRMAAEQAGASAAVVFMASLAAPAGAIWIGWTLAQRWNARGRS